MCVYRPPPHTHRALELLSEHLLHCFAVYLVLSPFLEDEYLRGIRDGALPAQVMLWILGIRLDHVKLLVLIFNLRHLVSAWDKKRKTKEGENYLLLTRCKHRLRDVHAEPVVHRCGVRSPGAGCAGVSGAWPCAGGDVVLWGTGCLHCQMCSTLINLELCAHFSLGLNPLMILGLNSLVISTDKLPWSLTYFAVL